MNPDLILPQRKHPSRMPVIDIGNRSNIIFLTVCSKDRKALFACDDVHQLMREVWNSAQRWMVGRYILMPDHIHLFCSPAQQPWESIRQWMKYWKGEATKRWPRPQERPIWQQDGWDVQLRRGESYSEKWSYVRQNPVRANLVKMPDEWPYQGELNVLSWHDQ